MSRIALNFGIRWNFHKINMIVALGIGSGGAGNGDGGG